MVSYNNLNMVGYLFLIWLVVDAVALSLVTTSAYKTYKIGGYSRLMNVIHRDGIMFYVYLLVLSLGNVIVVNVLPGELWGTVGIIEITFYSIFASRIILNIREVSSSSESTLSDRPVELHTCQGPSGVSFCEPTYTTKSDGDSRAWRRCEQTRSREGDTEASMAPAQG